LPSAGARHSAKILFKKNIYSLPSAGARHSAKKLARKLKFKLIYRVSNIRHSAKKLPENKNGKSLPSEVFDTWQRKHHRLSPR
jgi:hypothetical protein